MLCSPDKIDDLSLTNECISDIKMNSHVSRYKHDNVHLFFTQENFYVLFPSDKDKEKVYEIAMEISYSHILCMDPQIKKFSIILNTEPYWTVLPDFTRRYQKFGFNSLSFNSTKKIIEQIVQTVYKKNQKLLLVRTIPISSDIQIQPKISSEASIFEFPELIYSTIDKQIPIAIDILTKKSPEDAFLSQYGFLLEYSPNILAMEAIDPIALFHEVSSLQYTSFQKELFRHPFCFKMNYDYLVLSSPEADNYLFNSPGTVNIYRGSLSMNLTSQIPQIMNMIMSFVTMNLWQDADLVYQEQDADMMHMKPTIKLWMAKLYNRELWTAPLISYETMEHNCGSITFSMIKSNNFVRAVRDNQKCESFKKGVNSNWLPDGYCAGFFVIQKEMTIVLEYIEAIGWDFDPEFFEKKHESLALERAMTVANLASFIVANLH